MRHPLWFRLQGCSNDGIAGVLIVMRFATPTGCNLPYLPDTQIAHSLAPQIHCGAANFQVIGNRLVLLAIDRTQDNATTERDLLGSAMGRFPLFELRLFLRSHNNRETDFGHEINHARLQKIVKLFTRHYTSRGEFDALHPASFT